MVDRVVITDISHIGTQEEITLTVTSDDGSLVQSELEDRSNYVIRFGTLDNFPSSEETRSRSIVVAPFTPTAATVQISGLITNADVDTRIYARQVVYMDVESEWVSPRRVGRPGLVCSPTEGYQILDEEGQEHEVEISAATECTLPITAYYRGLANLGDAIDAIIGSDCGMVYNKLSLTVGGNNVRQFWEQLFIDHPPPEFLVKVVISGGVFGLLLGTYSIWRFSDYMTSSTAPTDTRYNVRVRRTATDAPWSAWIECSPPAGSGTGGGAECYVEINRETFWESYRESQVPTYYDLPIPRRC